MKNNITSGLFEGASETGDLPHAINKAIKNASEVLPSSFVWRLESIWGNSSGFVKVALYATDTSYSNLHIVGEEQIQLNLYNIYPK